MGKLLGRPVFTHEFAGRDALIAEADGKRNAPLSPLYSLAEVVGPERAAQAIARAHKEPPMIDISLSVKSEDAPPEAAEHWDTILPAWAEFDGESAVNAAAEAYFDTEKWDEWFGLDESDTHVLVTVHSPDSIAGVYSVSLDRVTKAYATKN